MQALINASVTVFMVLSIIEMWSLETRVRLLTDVVKPRRERR
jgi:hypothetical protein